MTDRNTLFKQKIRERLRDRRRKRIKMQIESLKQDIVWLEAEYAKKKKEDEGSEGQGADRKGRGDQGFLTKED